MRDVTSRQDDERFMARALQLAARGQGAVEPNPMVGCVIVRDGQVLAEGWHAKYGDHHAELVALKQLELQAAGATAYVTLEPCCHHGKTPPCTTALIHAGVARVVVAMEDPFPPVDGGGIGTLREAGIECETEVLAPQARQLAAPYLKRLLTGRPWVIAKWAMSLDGKIATAAGHSRWISNDASREVVQRLRGRVDAIVVGSGTARADDPLLTARPAEADAVKRTATRIVVDSAASLSLDSQLVATARQAPVLVAVAASADVEKCRQLVAAGVDIVPCAGADHAERFASLLDELGRRKMTNVLVEGGSRLLGTLFEARLIDEVEAFIAASLIGGSAAPGPIGGSGAPTLDDALRLTNVSVTVLDGDTHIRGRIER